MTDQQQTQHIVFRSSPEGVVVLNPWPKLTTAPASAARNNTANAGLMSWSENDTKVTIAVLNGHADYLVEGHDGDGHLILALQPDAAWINPTAEQLGTADQQDAPEKQPDVDPKPIPDEKKIEAVPPYVRERGGLWIITAAWPEYIPLEPFGDGRLTLGEARKQYAFTHSVAHNADHNSEQINFVTENGIASYVVAPTGDYAELVPGSSYTQDEGGAAV